MEDLTTSLYAKVLVVDDYLLNLELTTAMLEMMNYNVDSVDNCNEVIDKFTENDYNLILMNLNLSPKSGLELAKEIRESEKSLGKTRIPIIAITGMGVDTLDDECVEAGFDGCLPKPIDSKELETVLSQHLKS